MNGGSVDGTEQDGRFIEYIGESDLAKVEEHPFHEGTLSVMLLTEGHLKGRKMWPEDARELADALYEAADRAETADASSTEGDR